MGHHLPPNHFHRIFRAAFGSATKGASEAQLRGLERRAQAKLHADILRILRHQVADSVRQLAARRPGPAPPEGAAPESASPPGAMSSLPQLHLFTQIVAKLCGASGGEEKGDDGGGAEAAEARAAAAAGGGDGSLFGAECQARRCLSAL